MFFKKGRFFQNEQGKALENAEYMWFSIQCYKRNKKVIFTNKAENASPMQGSGYFCQNKPEIL